MLTLIALAAVLCLTQSLSAAPISAPQRHDAQGIAVPMRGSVQLRTSSLLMPPPPSQARYTNSSVILPVYNDAFRSGTKRYGVVDGVVGTGFNGGVRSSKSVTFRPASMSVPSASSFTKAGGTPTFATSSGATVPTVNEPQQLYNLSVMMRDNNFPGWGGGGGDDLPDAGDPGTPIPLTGEWLLLLFLAIMMITKRLLPLRGEVARSARGGDKHGGEPVETRRRVSKNM